MSDYADDYKDTSAYKEEQDRRARYQKAMKEIRKLPFHILTVGDVLDFVNISQSQHRHGYLDDLDLKRLEYVAKVAEAFRVSK